MRIETGRLVLRRWEARDLVPFAAINADPEVMDFPRPLTRMESDAEVADFEARWEADGFCFGAVERREDGLLLGMAGIARYDSGAAICPCVEIGWRLGRPFWGRGYATEAAVAWLDWGIRVAGMAEILAFTDPANLRSLAVMRKAGMQADPARDFEHPAMPPGHPLRPQVVWAATR